MKYVGVSLHSLFDALVAEGKEVFIDESGELPAESVRCHGGSIRKTPMDDGSSDFYYDLMTSRGTPCVDGEVCEIIEKSGDVYTLQQVDESIPFTLTEAEYNNAVFHA